MNPVRNLSLFLLALAWGCSALLAQPFAQGEHTIGISRLGISGSFGDPVTQGRFFRPVVVLRYGYAVADQITVGSDVGVDLAYVSNFQGSSVVWTGVLMPYLRAQLGRDELSFFLEGGLGFNRRFRQIAFLSPWVYQVRALVGVTYRPSMRWSVDLGIGYLFRYSVDAPVPWSNTPTPRLGFNLHFR